MKVKVVVVVQENNDKLRGGIIMRICLRCNIEMVEDLDIKVEGGAYGIKITQQGIFKDSLGKFKCAVCPECGYTETYIQDTNKIKKLVLDKKEK